VQDAPRSEQPSTQRTDANVDRVRTLVRSDRIFGVRLIANESNMNRETVRQIITDELGTREISAQMVPPILQMTRNNVSFIFPLILTQCTDV
jgi:hypothetical protein